MTIDVQQAATRSATADMTVPQSAAKVDEARRADEDRDSLHILPLSMIPLETPMLRRARLIKNTHLVSVIEFFRDADCGSGQMDIQDIAAEMDWPDDTVHPDLELLRKLARLPSYDVYSLRILLRSCAINVENHDALRLSATKTQELSSYMTQFTRPLMREIFGDDGGDFDTFDDVLALFRDPDISKARERLQTMADRLDITLLEVPRFLEDFGDIFLSLSYYRQCLDAISQIVSDFLDNLLEIMKNYQLKSDKNFINSCYKIEQVVSESMASLAGRFESFDRSTNDMWQDISAARFQKTKQLITEYHTTMGGVLCALTVKMQAWDSHFPNADFGGPIKRSEFIMSDLRQGIQRIQKIENNAPMLSQMAN